MCILIIQSECFKENICVYMGIPVYCQNTGSDKFGDMVERRELS